MPSSEAHPTVGRSFWFGPDATEPFAIVTFEAPEGQIAHASIQNNSGLPKDLEFPPWYPECAANRPDRPAPKPWHRDTMKRREFITLLGGAAGGAVSRTRFGSSYSG
jgi:hypothetical protein